MQHRYVIAGALFALAAVGGSFGLRAQDLSAPVYTADGKLQFPKDYREWIYLTSGLDMSYAANAAPRTQSIFDNVFVNRDAYSTFLKTGTWPDKTMMVLEVRNGDPAVSINTAGRTQGSTRGFEIHVKDTARFKDGGWAFFGFTPAQTPADMIAQTENCYSCHRDHAAVDTTFVQFYPTLLPVATDRKTLSPAYLAEQAKSK